MQRDLAEQIAKLQKDLRGESASEALPEGTELVPDDPLELFTILEARRWLPLIQEKTWVLLRSSNSSGLLISDSPLTLHNSREFGPYGNIGLGVPGIEIHLPLSSKLDLWMICPSLFAEFERGFKLAHSLRASGWSAAEIDAAISRVDRIRSGAPWDMTDDNVTHINHLQVVYSARFVYSEHGDFSLVERMLRDNASYRDGIRFKT